MCAGSCQSSRPSTIIDLTRSQAFKRHASLGFLAASAFPLPKDYLKEITLPAGLSVDGKSRLVDGRYSH